MSSPIRVAIIGMGGYAGHHHNALIELERRGLARLVCTCDPAAREFEGMQQHWGLPKRGVRVFSDHIEMLDSCRNELDMVVIPTPIPLHAAMHLACVERGLAVYLEKPPTLDPSELARMIATDTKARRSTLVGFNFIIEKPRVSLKERILQGEFGRLQEVRLRVLWPRPTSYFTRNNWAGRLQAPDGRLILDSCCGNAMAHFVHNALHWAGTRELFAWAHIENIKTELYRAHEIEGPDTFFTQVTTQEGPLLRIGLTHACTGQGEQMEMLVCDLANITYVVGSHYEIHWADGHREREPLPSFDPLVENHSAYYRYLHGEVPRPATRLEDSIPFVHLNALAYVSSGNISRFPDSCISQQFNEREQQTYYQVEGLTHAIDEFLRMGAWPSATQNYPTLVPARLVTPAELPRLDESIQTMLHAASR